MKIFEQCWCILTDDVGHLERERERERVRVSGHIIIKIEGKVYASISVFRMVSSVCGKYGRVSSPFKLKGQTIIMEATKSMIFEKGLVSLLSPK